jgi:hypothetical protein
MQSNKTSKKTSSTSAKKPASTADESPVVASAPAAKRATRSSKKKSDVTDMPMMASANHSHKLSSSVTVPVASAAPLSDTPARVARHQEIAERAYYYWAERGFRDGNPEEDWLRAEKALSIH